MLDQNQDRMTREQLRDQICSLEDQIKKLNAGELARFDLQNKLDFQLKIQAELIRLSHRCKTTFNETDIGSMVAETLVESFDYEKALVCLQETPHNRFSIVGLDGYYTEPERKAVVDAGAHFLSSLELDQVRDIRIDRSVIKEVPSLFMDERVLVPCRLAKEDLTGFIIFGNSSKNAKFHRAIDEADRNLWETIGAVMSSAFENARLYNHLDRERQRLKTAHDELSGLNERLEKKVEERTRALAVSNENYQALYLKSAQTSALYRTLLDASPDPIVVYDIKGIPIYVNPAFIRVFGWQFQEVSGKHIDYVPQENRIDTDEMIARLMRGEKITSWATRRTTKTGKILDISLSAAPYYGVEGEMAGCVVHLRDQTEQKKMEDELLKVRKLESVGLLAGGIAHDFNNILSGIMLNAQMAASQIEPEQEANQYLSGIEEATQKAASLTQQLLTFAKGGAPVLRTASITKLIKESAEFVLHGTSVRGAFDFAEGLSPVEMDVGQMNTVIHNLIINAIQAMPQGGVITISADNLCVEEKQTGPFLLRLRPGNYVKITIKDTGIGISREDLPRIFDPYFTTKADGNGLGLATAFSIIGQHHGHIAVESEETVGTTFHIYLPAGNAPVESAGACTDKIHFFAGRGKILVMDDEMALRNLTRSMLNRAGYEVETAADGNEAVQSYKSALDSGKPFDAVIMDLTVPGGMGGKKTIERLLEIDTGVKAIVFSGYATDPIMADYKRYGFKGVITKPFRIEQLTKTLRDVLEI
jgi:PAS domain S-box-containing protein